MPDRGADMVTFFLQHFVGLSLRLKKPDGSQQADVYSCFVIEMNDQWFLVTAGHILKRIHEELLPRCEVLECTLFDAWHARADRRPVPFNLHDNDHFEADVDEEGIDVGFLPLSDVHRRLLAANHIRPFDAVGWRGDLDAMTGFAVLGMPTQLIESVERRGIIDTIKFRPIMLSVRRVPEPSEMKKPFLRFYGEHAAVLHNEFGGTLDDLDGLSGGPILGFRPTNEVAKYHLVAIQSGWHRGLRVVTGPLFSRIALALAAYLADEKG